jgi:hypothetical protein
VTDRLHALLARLGLLLMIAAVAAPLLWGAAHVVIRRPDLQWAAVNEFWRPARMAIELQSDYNFGYTLVLKNRGNAPTEPVRILFDYPPRHYEMVERGPEDYTTAQVGEEGLAVDLGPLEPGERIRMFVYDQTTLQLDVLEGGERIRPFYRDVGIFDERLLLPRWAALAGTLLLAGLALQTLALRRSLRAQAH